MRRGILSELVLSPKGPRAILLADRRENPKSFVSHVAEAAARGWHSNQRGSVPWVDL